MSGRNRMTGLVRHLHTLLAGFAASVSTAALAQNAPEAFVTPDPLPDRVEMPGDNTRSCPSIRAEADHRLAEYDAIGKERDAMDYQKGGKTRALEALGSVGGSIPVIGGAVAMGALMGQMESTREDAKANYGAIDKRADWVLDRMSYLHELYRTRCVGGGR